MEDSNYRDYVSLLSLNYQRIHNFILILVANHNDADDIMQETSVVMFEKFNTFQLGSDFFAWAKTIAKYQVLNYLKKNKRNKEVVFNQKMIDLIDLESRERITKQDEWIEALRSCVALLSNEERQLLHVRYFEKDSIKVIADRLGCPVQKVYRHFSRIHGLLIQCVRRKINMCEA